MAGTAGARIKVDPADLTKAANAFQGNADKVKALTDKMLKTVDGVTSSVWSGSAQTAYKTQFDGLSDDMRRMHSMIKEHVTDLTEMAKVFQTAEDTNQQLATKLASDVIS